MLTMFRTGLLLTSVMAYVNCQLPLEIVTSGSLLQEPVVDVGQLVNNAINRTVDISSLIVELIKNGSSLSNAFEQLNEKAGEYECQGFSKVFGIDGTILGDSGIQSSGPFEGITWAGLSTIGGQNLCDRDCSGTCIPDPQNGANQPLSAYPFSCKCPADKCGAFPKGPVRRPDGVALVVSTTCVPSTQCTCSQMDTQNGATYDGYLCNWISIDNRTITYADFFNITVTAKASPYLSPIRWCDCCPKDSDATQSPTESTTVVASTVPTDTNPGNSNGDLPACIVKGGLDAPVNIGCTNGGPAANAVCDLDCQCVHKAKSGTCLPSPSTAGASACICDYNTPSTVNKVVSTAVGSAACADVRKAFYVLGGGACEGNDYNIICTNDCGCNHGAKGGNCVNGTTTTSPPPKVTLGSLITGIGQVVKDVVNPDFPAYCKCNY